MPAADAAKDVITGYDMPAEISGAGGVHIHATMAVQGDRAISGHLHPAQAGTWFARMHLDQPLRLPSKAISFSRLIRAGQAAHRSQFEQERQRYPVTLSS
jgi:hypothetical protein